MVLLYPMQGRNNRVFMHPALAEKTAQVMEGKPGRLSQMEENQYYSYVSDASGWGFDLPGQLAATQ
jgi:hypothetical protein